MRSRYRHVGVSSIVFIFLVGVLSAYNNCAKKEGSLDVVDLSSNGDAVAPVIAPPPPPSAPPPAPVLPDPFLANEFGGSGAMINSGLVSQVVLFQNADNTNLINKDGGAVQRNGIRNGYGMGAYVDPNDLHKIKFFVIDRDNNRILIFNQVPKTNAAMPDVVVGQVNFTDSLVNAGQAAVNNVGVNRPVNVSVCGDGKMLVADAANNRILIYNQIPKVSGAAADLVVGQANFTTNLASAGATGLNTPYAAYCFDRKLFVLDRGNQRIVVHNIFPAANNPAADFAIGQPDFLTVTSGCAADKFNTAYEIVRYKNELYVVDGNNHRILRFSPIPTAFGASAVNVIGQPDLVSCLPNQGLATAAANTINTANSLAVAKDTLSVTDWGNYRILFFTLPILANNTAAKGVLGQPGFITNTITTPPNATSVNRSKGMVFDGNFLWMNGGQDNRTLNMLLPIVP